MFPRYKPAGPNSDTSASAIRKENRFSNEVIDYLKLDIFKGDTKGGFNAIQAEEAQLGEPIYLYLPNKLSEQYSAKYNGVELGEVGAAAVGIAGDAIAAGGLPDSIGNQVAAAAQAAKPSIGYKIGADVINKAVGLTGANPGLDRNSLSALTTGKVFNPYEEAIFQGTGFRNHSFNFKMVPKNTTDVETIVKIIDKLRIAMLPGKDGKSWLTIPDYFRMSIIRHVSSPTQDKVKNPGTGEAPGVIQKLMSFPSKMVLTNMGVDYSPDGNYASLQTQNFVSRDFDYGPVSYNISLSFQETSYLTKESYKGRD